MTIQPVDQGRAARLLLACLDDEPGRAAAVIDEADAAGTVPALITAMAGWLASALVMTAGSDGARAIAERTVLDAQLADERPADA
ncbi:MAG: hypothetical protein GX610_22985 [Rhodococcus sp.]|nr:hypothetical protein [Rhodococcus sp. (in: high G+C Gram-positive bacteria)]